METPIAIALIALIALAVFSVLALNSNTKRWKALVEKERGISSESIERSTDLFNTVYELRKKLTAAETLAETRRVRVVQLEQEQTATKKQLGIANEVSETRRIELVEAYEKPHIMVDVRDDANEQGKIVAHTLVMRFEGGKYPGYVNVRRLAASKKNHAELEKDAIDIARRISGK